MKKSIPTILIPNIYDIGNWNSKDSDHIDFKTIKDRDRCIVWINDMLDNQVNRMREAECKNILDLPIMWRESYNKYDGRSSQAHKNSAVRNQFRDKLEKRIKELMLTTAEKVKN
jgi:hypothetical protein